MVEPINPKKTDKKRRSIKNLPAVNQTKINSEFFAATLDHLIQPQKSEALEGYIGSKPDYYNSSSDFYISEPTSEREFYQLTTAMVQRNGINKEIEKTLFYDDLINHLRFQGALVNNHERLFTQDYYSWQPPIDLDKFMNFSNYYWLPYGGKAIEVGVIRAQHQGNGIDTHFTTPDSLALDPALIEVKLDGSVLEVFDPTVIQNSWYKVVDSTTIRVFPIPSQNSIVEISLFAPTQSDIGAMVGSSSYVIQTYPGYTRKVSSGTRLRVINDVTSANNGKVFIVEGVGRAIWLVEDSIYDTAWDTKAWDSSEWDFYINVTEPDYLVMERGASNRNPWSMNNRWFHRDVVDNIADPALVKFQGRRPIIEFQKDLELYDYGSIHRLPIHLYVENIPYILDILFTLTEDKADFYANGFEITESKYSKQLVWRHVDYDIEIWSSVDPLMHSPVSGVWPSRHLGYSEVRINGVQLFDGLRLLVVNDPNPAVTNHIYEITGIAVNGQITPINTTDGQDLSGKPLYGETVFDRVSRKSYWFDGSWRSAQNKTSKNQAPLFALYDVNGNSLSNTGVYPKNNFKGNKIFSYAINEKPGARYDSVLDLRLEYDEFGEIIFENAIAVKRYNYINADNETIDINGFYFHRTFLANDSVFSNDWHKIPYESPQKYSQRFIVENKNNIFRLNMTPRSLPYSGNFVEVRLNNEVLIKSQQYALQDNILRIDASILNNGDQIDITMIGDLVDKNKISYVTEQFTYTGSNIFTLGVTPITPLTTETISAQVNGVMIDFDYINNINLEPNQIRIDASLVSGDVVDINVLVPIQKETEYSFWELPANLEVNPNNEQVGLISRSNFSDHFTTSIRRQNNFNGVAEAINNYRDTAKVNFLGDKILQHTAPMLKLMYMVADQNVDFIKSVRYVEREYTRFKNKFAQQLKLIQDRNELLDTDSNADWVELALSRLNVGKTAEFPFYNSGMAGQLTWIPPTPSFLGISGVYAPALVWDNTSGAPTLYIRGHDGSMLLAYNDKRDQVFLELESQIYASIPAKLKGETNLAFDFNKVKPGKFRTSPYTYSEYVGIISPIFERWTVNNSVNFRVNSVFDEHDPFTWNYSTSLDLEGNQLPGNWRGIYRYFFDTDKPHVVPWECLGFTEKPTWWDNRYGPGPYTRANVGLWNDIADGIIREGVRAGTYPHLARSSQTLSIWDVLPVGLNGELLNPIDAGIVRIPPSREQASQPWNPGDFGPVETVWQQSEQWTFANVQAAYLMRPAQFIESTWDTGNYDKIFADLKVNAVHYDQIVDLATGYRPNLTNIQLHNEQVDDTPLVRYGNQQFVASYLEQNGLDITSTLGDKLRNTYVCLGHKMAGYVANGSTKTLTDSFGILPNEDVFVKLYESPSVREEIYSGVIIEWNGKGYRVYGYDVLNPVFNTIPSNVLGRRAKITIGSKQPSFEEWVANRVYTFGELVIREQVFYRCKEAHRSGNTFSPIFWSKVDKPGTTAWLELTKRLDPMVGSPVVAVPYGTEFRTVQDVFDFLISYERYLESRGWLFDDYDEDLQLQKDWTYSGKQFATWSINQWAPGTFITVSPSSKKVRFRSSHGLIKPLEQVINGVYSLLNRNGDRIETSKTTVSRMEDTVEVAPLEVNDNQQGIFAARLYVTELEHIMLFSNRTIFNDLIYDPLYGNRQARLRIAVTRTLEWNGRLDAPGYLVANDKLISNFEKTTNDFRRYFDIENQVEDIGLKNYANHLIAYQQRPYLNQLIISDKSQMNFYQGMIQQKGTPGSLNKLLRSEFITQDSNLQMLEEWAFRLGSYGAYDAQPSLELRVPIRDYDNDPQLIEVKEVQFNDVSVNDLLNWIKRHEDEGTIIPTNNTDWTKEIWNDWFETFFKDDPNDKIITAYIVRDTSGRILAGDSRWEQRPDTTARSYTENIFPMIPYGAETPALPTAGYVHAQEYDHVYKSIDQMLSNGIYEMDNGSASRRRYKDGDVVWLYNTTGIEGRQFTLNTQGNNTVDYFGNDVFTGATSFNADWSIFRFLSQKWTIVSAKSVQASDLVEVETKLPHGLKRGEIIVMYDASARSIFNNPTPIKIGSIVSQYKFRISNSFTSSINLVNNPDLEVLKLIETRFNTLTKTEPTQYSLQNYMNSGSFDPNAASQRKDRIYIDKGVDVDTIYLTPTHGWVTLQFDWFEGENKDDDVLYARVPNTFSGAGWQIEKGRDANTLESYSYVLGKANLSALANSKYELIGDVDKPESETALPLYALEYDASNNSMLIWLETEWRRFAAPVFPASNLSVFGSYTDFSNLRKEKLVDFEGRFFEGEAVVSAGFAPINKFFRTAAIQDAAPAQGSYWIFMDEDGIQTDDQIYERSGSSWIVATYQVGDKFWDSNSKTMLEVTSVAPALAFEEVDLTVKDAWFAGETNKPFIIEKVDAILQPIQVVANEYYWYDSSSSSPSGVWKKLVGSVWTTTTIPSIGTYVYNLSKGQLYKRVSSPAYWENASSDINLDERLLLTNSGQCLMKTTSGFIETSFDRNEFIFNGTMMWYWDGTTASIAGFADGERWIAKDKPVLMDSSKADGYTDLVLIENEYWVNYPLGLLFAYVGSTGKFIPVEVSHGDLWANTETGNAYEFDSTDNMFVPTTLTNGSFYYDYEHSIMFVMASGSLEEKDFSNLVEKTWYNKGILYSSASGSLLPVIYAVGDLFYSSTEKQFYQFNGTDLVAWDGSQLANAYYLSNRDNSVYGWDGTDLTFAQDGLYTSALNLYDWTNRQLDQVIVDHLSFKVVRFINANSKGKETIIGSMDLLDYIDASLIEFPGISQIEGLEYEWASLGPILRETRRQLQKVDSHAIHNSLFYDSYQNQTDAYLYAFDPVKGIIPGNADREIWFKLTRDPAVYVNNSLIVNDRIENQNVWGNAQIGMTWWDLSTSKYLEYEMDDLEYRRNNWGKLAPLSSVDIYEWTRSLKTPEEYAREVLLTQSQNENETRAAGIPYSVNGSYPYNSLDEFDSETNVIKTYNYFWVKNKQTLPSTNRKKYNRTLTAAQISQILSNPSGSGVIWANPISDNAFVFANATGLISGHDSVLQINWRVDHNDGNIHRHYVLGREGDEDWIADDPLWQKMQDSLLGYVYYKKQTFIKSINGTVVELNEANGLAPEGLIIINGEECAYKFGDGNFIELINIPIMYVGSTVEYEALLNVPDTVLTESQRYGNLFRPRQSWFKDIKSARRNFVENFNQQMQQVWLDRDRFDWSANLFQSEPIPESSEYDKTFPDILSRDIFTRNNIIADGYRVLIEGNLETDGYWSIWRHNALTKDWTLLRVQRYRLDDFWERADFYDESVDPSNKPLRVFKTEASFANEVTQNAIEFNDNELIQILNVWPNGPSPIWEWRRYSKASDSWSTVAREKGTIRLKDAFFTNDIKIVTKDHFYRVATPAKRRDYTPYWDLVPYDKSPWDATGFTFDDVEGKDFSNLDTLVQYIRSRDGSIELGLILDEIRSNQNFLSYLEQNRLFFSMINYVHVEQPIVDWAFKTSYIVIAGYTEQLMQSKIVYPDIIEPLFEYINEVKPYHVKIRDFSRRVGYLDQADVCVTDFDKPVWEEADGTYRVLNPENVDDKEILNSSVDDCYANPYQAWAKASGLSRDNIQFSPLVRNIAIEQRFDRVSCDSTTNTTFSPVWDLVPWDVYPWDPMVMPSGTLDEPYIFRIRSDGKSVAWDLKETITNRFFNVIAKSSNVAENLLYYPVSGYEADSRWSNIDRVAFKDPAQGTETILPESQWSIIDVSTVPGVPQFRLTLNITPKQNQIVEVVRNITELDRIQRMYKVITQTKLGGPILDIIPSLPQISGCDFGGVNINGRPFSLGWDTDSWDFNSGAILLPERQPGTPLNRTLETYASEPDQPEALLYWFDDTETSVIEKLKYWDTLVSQWKPVDPLYTGDTIVLKETQVIRIWNGFAWLISQSMDGNGWDSLGVNFVDSQIINETPKEWEFFIGTGSKTLFELTVSNVDYGDIGHIVVFVDDQQMTQNGSNAYDYTWDSNGITFNTAPPAGVKVKVFKVYDYNGSGNITSTFLPAVSNPTQDPWEVLVDGGQFIQPWIGPNRPEELAYLSVKTPLLLDIYNRPAPGAPILAKNQFKGTGATGPFQLYHMAQSEEAIYVFENGLLVDDALYTVDWATQSITFTSPTIVGGQYLIASHSTGGNALWETKYFKGNGSEDSYALPGLPSVNKLMVTINGIETKDFTINGPTFTSLQLEAGVPFRKDDFLLVFDVAPAVDDLITISVFVNMVDTVLFDPNITVANTDEFTAGNPSAFVDLGPYHNETGNATEFTLTQESMPEEPAWDKIFVYVNGKRICGPQTVYAQGDGIHHCFDVPPITTPIDKTNYIGFIGGETININDWFITTSLTGLENAFLHAGDDNLPSLGTGWSYLQMPSYTWSGKIHMKIYDANDSWEDDIPIFDRNNDGKVSNVDVIASIIDEIVKPYWEDARNGLSFDIVDGRIEITHRGSKTVELTEVDDVPLVTAFFGKQAPSIESIVTPDPYVLGGTLNGLPDLWAGSTVVGVTPAISNIPAGLGNIFDMSQSPYSDSTITVTIDYEGIPQSYVVDIYDGIKEEMDGSISVDPLLADGVIDVNDLYLSLKLFFETHETPTGPIKVGLVGNSWDTSGWSVSWWDLITTVTVCAPPKTVITLSDNGDNPIVGPFYGTATPTLVGDVVTGVTLPVSSAQLTVRLNRIYATININDYDMDTAIGIDDIIDSINNDANLQGLGITAVDVSGSIQLTSTNYGFLQVLNADANDIATTFFGASTFTVGTSKSSSSGLATVCEAHEPRFIVYVNTVPITVPLTDFAGSGELSVNDFVDLINDYEPLTDIGISARADGGKVILDYSGFGHIEVRDDFETFEYRVVTHFFGSWLTSSAATAVSAPTDKICFGHLEEDSPGYGWTVIPTIPDAGEQVVIGVFEGHSFEVNGSSLRILSGVTSGDSVSVVVFNDNSSMTIRTEQFVGNSKGKYALANSPATDEYLWVSLNGDRLVNDVHYTVEIEEKGWDVDFWDPIEVDSTYTPGWDVPKEYHSVVMNSGQNVWDNVCISSFGGDPRTSGVAWRMFRTDSGQWEHIRISDANKTFLKSDLTVDATYMDVWENDILPEYLRVSTPLMAPNNVYRLPGTVWINGERINYWEIQGPYVEDDRRWWRLGPIVRSTFKTTFGIEDKSAFAEYIADGTNDTFAIPSTSWSKVIVEVIGPGAVAHTWDDLDPYQISNTFGWDRNPWDLTMAPAIDVRMIPRDTTIEAEVNAGTFVPNSSTWDWDYEIVGNNVVFKNPPIKVPNVEYPSIRITAIEDNYLTNNVTHLEGSTVVDGNINQRLPEPYAWRWNSIVRNYGMQRNRDLTAKFLLERPGSIE